MYRFGRGEQGVLLTQPHESEPLPLWRFKNPGVARESADSTRARRYANHRGGRKYDGPVPADQRGRSGAHGRAELPRQEEDPVKAAAALIFKAAWDAVEQVSEYTALRDAHREAYG
ncbi:MAG: DUF4385 family protein [Nostocoides sp.]